MCTDAERANRVLQSPLLAGFEIKVNFQASSTASRALWPDEFAKQCIRTRFWETLRVRTGAYLINRSYLSIQWAWFR